VLPAAEGREGAPGRFADTAVPALLDGVLGLGARKARLEAVLVGGANMFWLGGHGLEVGQRNEAAVREQLQRLRVPVAAADTGGVHGRTVRVSLASGTVTSKAAGGPETVLHPKAPGRARAAS
jgi:chemotaxis protein CheD